MHTKKILIHSAFGLYFVGLPAVALSEPTLDQELMATRVASPTEMHKAEGAQADASVQIIGERSKDKTAVTTTEGSVLANSYSAGGVYKIPNMKLRLGVIGGVSTETNRSETKPKQGILGLAPTPIKSTDESMTIHANPMAAFGLTDNVIVGAGADVVRTKVKSDDDKDAAAQNHVRATVAAAYVLPRAEIGVDFLPQVQANKDALGAFATQEPEEYRLAGRFAVTDALAVGGAFTFDRTSRLQPSEDTNLKSGDTYTIAPALEVKASDAFKIRTEVAYTRADLNKNGATGDFSQTVASALMTYHPSEKLSLNGGPILSYGSVKGEEFATTGLGMTLGGRYLF